MGGVVVLFTSFLCYQRWPFSLFTSFKSASADTVDLHQRPPHPTREDAVLIKVTHQIIFGHNWPLQNQVVALIENYDEPDWPF